MSEHKCPVCGDSQSASALCEVNGFSVYGCKVCGADYVSPMPSNESLKAYYDREEWFEGGEVGGYQNYDQQTAWSVDAIKPILEEFEGRQGLSVLDVGCGYGTHLDLAASLGWKCFGVEVSDHARQTAQQRLAGKAYIVEAVADLIPHEFDLVLMLDVIEHLPSPYTLFYNLFSIGAITPKTRIIISTPNAGSDEARQNPAEWSYRHPPSHLVYYSADALRFLLKKLHFSSVNVQGVHPLPLEHPKLEEIAAYGGLLAAAKGSDFTEFMRERYVPGTWSKIAEYEHLPRYELAKRMAVGKSVLDFGCGTGYGSATLSQVAANVTGLDIDRAAISWANTTHHNPRLTFHRCNDLGSTLPSASFDVATCFEMIEHVDYETQQAVIGSIARLLRDNGLLIISTPNPEITKLYGANPYHLREMTLPEFQELLAVHFSHIRIMEQRVRNSIAFDEVATSQEIRTQSILQRESVLPLAFIAFCSKQPIAAINSLVMFDEEVDLIQDTLSREKKLNLARFDAYRLGELACGQKAEVQKLNATVAAYQTVAKELQSVHATLLVKDGVIEVQSEEIHQLNAVVADKNAAVTHQAQEIGRLNKVVEARDAAYQAVAEELQSVHGTLSAKNDAIEVQAEEIHRINAVVTDKEAAYQSVAEELQSVHSTLLAKDGAIKVQAKEIHRLNAVVTDKEAAYQSVAEELQRVHSTLLAKDDAIKVQAEEIHRLKAVVTDKEAAYQSVAEELQRVHGTLLAKDDAIEVQAKEIRQLSSELKDTRHEVAQHLEEINHSVSLARRGQSVETLNHALRHMEEVLTNVKEELLHAETELQAVRRTKWFRLRDAIIHQPWGFRKVARVAYLAGAMATPQLIRTRLSPLVYRIRSRHNDPIPVLQSSSDENGAYLIRQPAPALPNRPRVVHIIANFMTGGSSRLVVDLIEYLGAHYEQSVVTSSIPAPPAYIGVDITEFRFPKNEQLFVDHFSQLKPDLLHVHYWGDCDEPWYAKAITAAEHLGIPIIENINTPVTPYISSAVKRYIYVSDYVRQVFGQNHPAHVTIYPGSDFSHFDRKSGERIAGDCVGMVYRLERDKLNEGAIISFIKAVQKRPQTRVLIVGGGSLLEPFRHAVAEAGLNDNFEFTGYVSYDALPDLYRRMSVFVAPVWKESFGQVSPFAMNMRVPVVGYDIGAIGEIVANQALLAEPENPEMLSDIIVRLLDAPAEREKVAEFQRRRAQNYFSVQAMIKAYGAIYQEMMAGRTPKYMEVLGDE